MKQPYRPHPVRPDLSLPFYSGYYRCNEIRKLSKVPVVFFSPHTENMDIIVAMNMGADDDAAEPFSLELVVAKLQERLRRNYLNIFTNTIYHVRKRPRYGTPCQDAHSLRSALV